jgi:hypothetical protein
MDDQVQNEAVGVEDVVDVSEQGGDEAQGAEWLANASPEQVEFAKSIGADNDPSRALAAALGAEASRRQMQSERDQMRAFMEQMQSQQQAAPGIEQDAGPFSPDMPPDLDSLAQAFGGNEAAAIDFIAQTRAQEAIDHLRQQMMDEMQGMVAPIAQHATQNQMQQAAEELSATYGDEYAKLAPEVAQFIQSNPDLNSPRGMWQAFGMVHAQKQHQQALQRARQSQADDIGGGSSRQSLETQQADAAKAVLDAIDGAGGSRKTGYTGI